jgi:hypothetical protein
VERRITTTASLKRDCIEIGVQTTDAVVDDRSGAPCERAGAAAFGTSSMKSDRVMACRVAGSAPALQGEAPDRSTPHCITASHVRSTVSDAVQTVGCCAPGGALTSARYPSSTSPLRSPWCRSSRAAATASLQRWSSSASWTGEALGVASGGALGRHSTWRSGYRTRYRAGVSLDGAFGGSLGVHVLDTSDVEFVAPNNAVEHTPDRHVARSGTGTHYGWRYGRRVS